MGGGQNTRVQMSRPQARHVRHSGFRSSSSSSRFIAGAGADCARGVCAALSHFSQHCCGAERFGLLSTT
eukprot:6172268-Alexandrium_andersonii.AAC.1